MIPLDAAVTDKKRLDLEQSHPIAAKISAATSLADLSSEFVLFSHAAVFGWLNQIEFDPVQQFVQTNPECGIAFLDFPDNKVFDGCSAHKPELKIFDHRLFLVHKQFWQTLVDFITVTGIALHDGKMYARLYAQNVKVLDQMKTGVTDKPPYADAVVFGVMTNKYYVAVNDGHGDTTKPGPFYVPKFYKRTPRKEDVKFANDMRWHKNPYGASNAN